MICNPTNEKCQLFCLPLVITFKALHVRCRFKSFDRVLSNEGFTIRQVPFVFSEKNRELFFVLLINIFFSYLMYIQKRFTYFKQTGIRCFNKPIFKEFVENLEETFETSNTWHTCRGYPERHSDNSASRCTCCTVIFICYTAELFERI